MPVKFYFVTNSCNIRIEKNEKDNKVVGISIEYECQECDEKLSTEIFGKEFEELMQFLSKPYSILSSPSTP